VPGYVSRAAAFHAKGVSDIVCISVNDAFVMAAWGKDQGADGKVRMLADPNAELTKAMGLEVELAKLGGTRCKRFAAVVTDGVITKLAVEPESGTGLTCSLADPLLQLL